MLLFLSSTESTSFSFEKILVFLLWEKYCYVLSKSAYYFTCKFVLCLSFKFLHCSFFLIFIMSLKPVFHFGRSSLFYTSIINNERIETGLRTKRHMDGLKTGRSASIAGLYSVKNEHTELSSSRETSVCGDRCWTEESTPPVAGHGSRKDHGTLVCTLALLSRSTSRKIYWMCFG